MPEQPNLNANEIASFLRAQYQGLRDEITSRNNAIVQIQAFTLLAFGTILTLAYAEKAQTIGRNLVLFYSIIALFSYCIYFSNKSVIYNIGRFIRHIDKEYIYNKDNYEELSWEHHGVAGLQLYRLFRLLAVAFLYLGTEAAALIVAWYFPPSGVPGKLGGDPAKQGYLSPFMLGAGIATFILTFFALVFFEDWQKDGSLLDKIAKKKKIDKSKSIVQSIQGDQFEVESLKRELQGKQEHIDTLKGEIDKLHELLQQEQQLFKDGQILLGQEKEKVLRLEAANNKSWWSRIFYPS